MSSSTIASFICPSEIVTIFKLKSWMLLSFKVNAMGLELL